MWVKLWLNGKERDLKRQHMMLIWKCEPILQSWEVHSRYIFTITLFPWIVWYVALFHINIGSGFCSGNTVCLIKICSWFSKNWI
jgi:hypothetical protein